MKVRFAGRTSTGNYSRQAARHFQSGVFLDRQFSDEKRRSGPTHIREILPGVLRNLAVQRNSPTPEAR